MKREKNVALCILFSIFTCGIYGLYWMACVNDELNLITNDRKSPSGVAVIFLSIFTCGIYTFFWNFTIGQKIDKIKYNEERNTGILYLVLGIFIPLMVVLSLVQNELNNLPESYNE